MQILHTKYYWY